MDAMGLSAARLRHLYTMIGEGWPPSGAYLSLAYTKMWGEGMSAGRAGSQWPW